MERSRLLASSDRASLLSTDSTGSVDTTKHRQQLGNYFTNNVYLTDPWNDEDYYYNQNPKPNHDGPTWRSKERLKTYGVALVVCLNIGTDPPDVIKPTPCARRECWFDPVGNKQQCLEYIGNALQSQYEKWQQKVKFKQCLDPTAEELRRICINLRKNSKNDRLLLHYNGHGVPKPTKNGELWVFGKHYTHYTPVAVYELRHWLSDPAVYVLDCSGAAVLIPHLVESVSIRANGGNYSTEEFSTMHSGQMQPDGPTIVFAACKENEVLPMNPMYPADMFTACLTTPVTIAIRWFILQNPYSMTDISADIALHSGKESDRKTPIGELTWIFIAITDTIAWNCLPAQQFQRLFRQDLLVASLFRNFMIAKRIMKCFNCHPQSWPRLPDTSTHPLWQSWELTVESYIMHNVALTRGSAMVNPRNNMPFSVPSSPTFFTDQLTAFELWLDYELPSADPPARLPIVLQVLLSQLHRVRALQLLRRYLALGAEAVNLSLVVGIFPYILKLLLSASEDIKQALVSIWASIMGFDSSCRQELIRAKSQAFFIQYLKSSEAPAAQRCMAAFVLAEICDGYIEGQQTCLHNGLHKVCTSIISEDSVLASPLLKKWTCLCLYKLCEEFRWAKYLCLTEANHNQLYPLLVDGDPTVRAATVLALGELFGASALLQLSATFDKPENSTDKEHKSNPIVSTDKDLIDEELQLALQLLECCSDGSPMVRLEAVLALSKFFQQETHINYIKLVAQEVSKRLSTRKFPRKAAVIASKNDEYKSSSLTKDSVPYPWKLSHKEIMEVVEVLEEFISRSHTFNDTPDRILNKRASPSSVNNTVNTSIDKTNLSIGLAQITLDVDEDGRPRAFSNEGTFVPRTPALQAIMAQAYVQLWLAVTELQGTDPFGAVVEISTAIRNRVNAMVMVDVQRSKDLKMGKLYLENDDSYGQFVGSAVSMESARPHPFSPGGEVSYYRSSFTPNESVLSTSTDSAARLPIVYRTASPFERQASDKQADSFTNWQNSMKGTPGEGHKTVQWDASSPERMRCVSPFRPEAIERSMSDRKGSNANFIDDSDGAATAIDSSESIIINSIVKKSNFYFMTKSLFTEPEGSFDPYADPLSIEGSTMVYRNTKLNEIMKAEETILKIFRDVDERSDIHLIERKPKVSVDDMNLSKTSIVSSLSASVTKFEQKSIISLDSASNGSRRSLVMFHGFQNILAISSGKSVAIWSLEKDRSHIMDIPTRRSSVRAKGGEVGYSSSVDSSLFAPVYTPGVTSMTWINESFESLLLIGTDDGVINVWRDTANSDVHSENQGLNSSNGQSGNVNNGSGLSNGHNASFIRSSSPAPGGSSIKRGITDVGNAQPAIELATAFCALPDVAENTLGSGLIVNWQQSSGILTVGGNSTEIRVWDLGKEQHTRIFNTGIDTCLTAMTSKCGPQNQFTNSIYMDNFSSPSYVEDIVLPWTFAGFADGSVAAYDGRVHSNGGRIHYSRNHGAWINNAHLRYDIPEVITSAVNGTIKFWDLRTMRAYKTLDVQKSLLTAMCVHNCAPIMAAGSQAKFIKLLTLGGEQLGNIIKYHDGFMGQRIGAISSLAFHPYKLTLAAGCADNIVSIYSTADCS